MKTWITTLIIVMFNTPVYSMTMQELFDSVNAQGNVNNPAVLQGQTMNLYTGGSLFMRMPKRTYQLANITAPSWNAGCGGIDLYMGGFSYINKEQFVAMMRNIGSNALGYGFKLAIQNLCPTCDNVMQSLQATAQQINRLNMDSCEAAKGVVNAALPDTWDRGRQNVAKNFGVDANIFENITDAWTNVMNNEKRANETVNDIAKAKPEIQDQLPTGNIVWKALKKLNGIDDEYRMILMSMIGTTVFNTDTTKSNQPRSFPQKDISVEQLVGISNHSIILDFPIWRCDTTTDNGCLYPFEGHANDKIAIKSFRAMVSEKMWAISDKIASRQSHNDLEKTMAFLNVTDLPIYKMLAVATSLNNTALADSLISRYQDLIAAKYAEVYIQLAVKDLQAALSNYMNTAGDPAINDSIKQLQPQLSILRADAQTVLSKAYAQTISTHNIAQELQYMERAMNANLSQTLRNSLAFGRSIR